MTITYTGNVANARLGSFIRLLFYWRGSIYKLMYKEMLIFCALFTTLSLVYRLALPEAERRVFEQIVLYCQTFTDLIPMSFILGFYVSIVVTRWWNQYTRIPWPDRLMMYLSSCIEGADEYGRLVRRTIVRYLTLGSLIVFQATAVSVKKRFPTMEHLIEAGVITPNEVKELEEISCVHGKWWIPFMWATNILKDALREGRIKDSYTFKTLIDELMTYRGNLGDLYSYDWISVPLVYTQVTTLAVYIFFLGALFGRQFLDPAQGYPGHTVDLYFPLFTLLQFFFYMGWLKVAEQLINPFGEDDDDFEMNWIIDRNMQISLLAVDDMYDHYPPMEKDFYYGEHPPEFLPYTKSSIRTKIDPHVGSTADLSVSDEGMRTVPMETIQEGVPFKSSQLIYNMQAQFGHNVDSPCVSPSKQKKYIVPNIMSGMRSPFSVSKSTMDGMGLGSSMVRDSRFHIHHTDESPNTSKPHSYLEQWLHRAEEKKQTPSVPIHSFHRPSDFHSRQASVAHLSVPETESLMFKMDIENGIESHSKHPEPAKALPKSFKEDEILPSPLKRTRSSSLDHRSKENLKKTVVNRAKGLSNMVSTSESKLTGKEDKPLGKIEVKLPDDLDPSRSRHTSSSDGSVISYGKASTSDSMTPLLKHEERPAVSHTSDV